MRRIIQNLLLLLVFLGLTGCAKNPATMSQAEVEALLQKEWSFKQMTITPNPDGGGFTGTGLDPDGTKFKITVIQDAKERKLSYSAVSESDPDERKAPGVLQLK